MIFPRRSSIGMNRRWVTGASFLHHINLGKCWRGEKPDSEKETLGVKKEKGFALSKKRYNWHVSTFKMKYLTKKEISCSPKSKFWAYQMSRSRGSGSRSWSTALPSFDLDYHCNLCRLLNWRKEEQCFNYKQNFLRVVPRCPSLSILMRRGTTEGWQRDDGGMMEGEQGKRTRRDDGGRRGENFN